MDQVFFELLQVAIGKKDCLNHSPSAEEWKGLYYIAKKQSLVGVSFAGVQKLAAHQKESLEMLYLTWMGMAAKIQQRNEVVNRQYVELQERFRNLGYRSCVLKGQSAAKLYRGAEGSIALLRQSGDIDIWIDAPRTKIIEMVQNMAPTTNVREHHLELKYFQDTEVEVHFWPAVIRHFRKNRKLQVWFEGKRKEVFEKGEPTPEFHAIQMMAHMYHHLFDSGIGLRQVMDYYMVLQTLCGSPLKDERYEDVIKTIKHIGMGRFASAMMWVIAKVFDPSALETWSQKSGISSWMLCEPNEVDGRFLLGEIMRGGNFGHHDEWKTRNTKNYFSSFYGSIYRNMRYLRFNPFDWFWSPLWRLYYFGWRKIHGYH